MRALSYFLILCALPIRVDGVGADDVIALSQRQAGVARRYQRLEELLLRLADVESAENPERSALLRRAARQSRDKFVLERMRSASESLRTQEYQKAVENQETAEQELSSILKLLLSEDRSKRIRDEKEWTAKLIKDLRRTLKNQRSARARTENDADIDDVKDEQEAVTRRSQELKDRISQANQPADASQSPSGAKQNSDQQSGKSENKDKKESGKKESGKKESDKKESGKQESGKQESDKKENGKQEPGDSKESQDPKEADKSDQNQDAGDSSERGSPKQSPSNPQSPSRQQPSRQGDSQQDSPEGQQSQSQSQQDQRAPEQSPSDAPKQAQPQSPEQEVEQRLQKAIEQMQEAEKELENVKREQATEKQRQAEENLRAAIDRLEMILRQLREEEMQRELAKLESRLRKMAAMQTKIFDDTGSLAATPASQRNRQTDLKAGDLAFEEKRITLEADRAMLLLREEGSSVAFPEVISQIRSDTTRVADRLGETKIDAVTQGIQQDILAALEEMIAAIQKAQRDLEKQRQQQQQGKPRQSAQGEQPLVEALAELKLIRTMETRVKSTTDRYAGLLESGQTSVDEVQPLLQDLSERQNRLYRITRDLVLRRNQ